jgi:photosystem II stability/assembly factor-like uncharacterized protein
VGLALIVSGCTTGAKPGSAHTIHVLGEPKGTPLVLGQPAPTGTGDLGAVSCATTKRCWAVGIAGPDAAPSPAGSNVIVDTTNGGRTWKAQHVVGGSTPQLTGVSCPSPNDCVAVGSNGLSLPGSGVVLATTNAGSTWNQVAAPPGALAVMTVVCSTVSDCLALVSDGTLIWSAASTNFGQSWQREGNMPSLFLPGADVSCTIGGPCLVAGYVPTATGHGEGAVALSTDGGQTWTLASVPNGVGVLRSAACVTAMDCLAAGSTSTAISDVVPAQGEMLRSSDGGHTWQPSTTSLPVDDVFDVECPSALVCAMVGTEWQGNPAVGTGSVAQSSNAGTTFRHSSAAYVPLTLTAVSCPSATACIAAGGDTVARITVATPRTRPAPQRSHGATRA